MIVIISTWICKSLNIKTIKQIQLNISAFYSKNPVFTSTLSRADLPHPIWRWWCHMVQWVNSASMYTVYVSGSKRGYVPKSHPFLGTPCNLIFKSRKSQFVINKEQHHQKHHCSLNYGRGDWGKLSQRVI